MRLVLAHPQVPAQEQGHRLRARSGSPMTSSNRGSGNPRAAKHACIPCRRRAAVRRARVRGPPAPGVAQRRKGQGPSRPDPAAGRARQRQGRRDEQGRRPAHRHQLDLGPSPAQSGRRRAVHDRRCEGRRRRDRARRSHRQEARQGRRPSRPDRAVDRSATTSTPSFTASGTRGHPGRRPVGLLHEVPLPPAAARQDRPDPRRSRTS